MRVATVESTTLLTVSYDDARELLQLEFCSRAVYQYFSVPQAVHQSLLPARGVRKFLPGAIVEEIPMARTLAELPAGSRITD